MLEHHRARGVCAFSFVYCINLLIVGFRYHGGRAQQTVGKAQALLGPPLATPLPQSKNKYNCFFFQKTFDQPQYTIFQVIL